MIDYIQKKGYKRIGLIHDSTGWGQSGRIPRCACSRKPTSLSAGPRYSIRTTRT
jgi:hypothetical protein